MLCTVLNYIQLRLLGEEADNEACDRGRKWILDHGGALYIPSWGKIWLSVSIVHLFHIYVYVYIKIFKL